MSQKSTSPIDRHIGQRIRMQRTLLGVSQERLGELLGITFQQVQKYEKGKNRISASRLHDLAQVLGVEVPFFFEGSLENGKGDSMGPGPINELLSDRDGVELARAFVAITDPVMRRAIIDLVRATAASCGSNGRLDASALGAPAPRKGPGRSS